MAMVSGGSQVYAMRRQHNEFSLLFNLANRLLVRGLKLRLDLRQHRLVRLVLHTELALALRDAAEVARVPEHVVQRDLGDRCELVLAHLAVDDRTATLVQTADNGACERAETR